MKKKAAILLILVVLVVAIGWQTSNIPDPRYQNRPLSQWIKDLPTQFHQPIGLTPLSQDEASLEWQAAQQADFGRPLTPANRSALEAINALGPRAVPWLVAHFHPKPPLRLRLFQFATKHKAPSFITNFMQRHRWYEQSPDPFAALCLLGSRAHSAVPHMLKRLADPNESVRQRARQIIEAAFKREADVPPLLAMLTNPITRVYAFPLLAAKAPHAIPKAELLAGFHDRNLALRQASLAAAARMGTNAVEYLPQISELSRHKESYCRYLAVSALGSVGAPAAEILRELYARPGENEEWKAHVVSATMSPQGDITQGRALLAQYCAEKPGNAEQLMRYIAGRATLEIWDMASLLQELNAVSPQTITAFLESMPAMSDYAQARTCVILGGLTGKAPLIVPFLTSKLKDHDFSVRCNSALALGKLGPKAASALGTLKEMQNAEKPLERACVNKALQAISPALATPAQ